MTKTKSTKSALISAILVLCMLFTSLIGTTFAWFTDSVTSSGNVIQTGNLDVQLLMYNGIKYVDISDSDKPIFGENSLIAEWEDVDLLWEPGKTQIVYLGVKNAGSLALKYNVLVDVADNGLVGALDYAIVDGATKDDADTLGIASWDDILAVEGVQTGLIQSGRTVAAESGALESNGYDYFALAIHMKKEAGNEYKDKSVVIDINVVATQLSSEGDSFGNDYDAGLDPATNYMFSGVDFNRSTTQSGKFGLSENITTSDNGDGARYGYGYEYIIRNGVDYTLDLNGKTIVHDTVNENANHNAFTYLFVANNAGTKLTIDGEGKIYSVNSEGYACAVQGKDGTLVTLNGGDFQVDNGIAVWAGAGSHIVINNGSYINGNATTDHELIYSSGGVIDIYGGFFHNTDGNYTLNVEDKNRATGFINVYGGTYVNFDPSTGGQDPNNIRVADGYMVTSEVQDNGDVWYTVVPVPEGYTPVSSADELKLALENKESNIILTKNISVDETLVIEQDTTISGGKTISRASGYTGTVITAGANSTLTLENIILDGSGATATGNLIAAETNAQIVLNEGTVLQNNVGSHAVNLGTRIGATLTLNGAHIINNSSDSGAIWGGGHITINEGSKINNNSSTGIGGAIRMVSNCNLTINGGEISNNYAAGDGGAIWGYGSSTYNFNGGSMSNNVSEGTGGAIYTGTYSVINISGDFEMCDNKAANSGAIRLTDHTSLNMTGGKISGNTQNGVSNAFNTWNNTISITGGQLTDNISYVGGLGLTIGAADIDGVIAYDLSTNHNTAYLAAEFNAFKFTVNEADEHFVNFNFKPAADYTYAEGDEDKLVCMNDGYETYWDAEKGVFKLQAIN